MSSKSVSNLRDGAGDLDSLSKVRHEIDELRGVFSRTIKGDFFPSFEQLFDGAPLYGDSIKSDLGNLLEVVDHDTRAVMMSVLDRAVGVETSLVVIRDLVSELDERYGECGHGVDVASPRVSFYAAILGDDSAKKDVIFNIIRRNDYSKGKELSIYNVLANIVIEALFTSVNYATYRDKFLNRFEENVRSNRFYYNALAIAGPHFLRQPDVRISDVDDRQQLGFAMVYDEILHAAMADTHAEKQRAIADAPLLTLMYLGKYSGSFDTDVFDTIKNLARILDGLELGSYQTDLISNTFGIYKRRVDNKEYVFNLDDMNFLYEDLDNLKIEISASIKNYVDRMSILCAFCGVREAKEKMIIDLSRDMAYHEIYPSRQYYGRAMIRYLVHSARFSSRYGVFRSVSLSVTHDVQRFYEQVPFVYALETKDKDYLADPFDYLKRGDFTNHAKAERDMHTDRDALFVPDHDEEDLGVPLSQIPAKMEPPPKPVVPPTLVVIPAELDKPPPNISKIAGKKILLTQITQDTVSGAREQLIRAWPHAAEQIDTILADLMTADVARIRPTLLVGPPGTGKTKLAKRLCDVVGLKKVVFQAAGSSDSSFGGTSRHWSTGRMSMPLQTIARYKIADPVIVIDEIDKIAESRHNGSLSDVLIEMIERESASEFFDLYLEASVDLSRVQWLATANDISKVNPTLLNRFRILHVPVPETKHLPTLVTNLVADIAEDRGVDARWIAPLDGDELAVIKRVWQTRSIRQLRRAVEVLLDNREAADRAALKM